MVVMREKLLLAVIYFFSFLLMLSLTYMMVPLIFGSPIFLFSILLILVENIIIPLFNVFTPLGGVLFILLVIIVGLKLILIKENTRAAACFMPGVGVVCAIMEYSKKDKEEFVEFYTIQGLLMFGITLVIFVTSIILMFYGGRIGALLGYYMMSLLFIVGGLLLIYMIYKAYSGKKVKLIPTSL